MDTISLASLGMVMEALEEGVLFLDEQRNIVAINPSPVRMIGRKHDDVIDKSCPTVFPGTPCAHTCEESGKCSLMEGTLQADKLVQDFVVARQDGALVPLHMCGQRRCRRTNPCRTATLLAVFCAAIGMFLVHTRTALLILRLTARQPFSECRESALH